jgi:hypothetical protein
LDQVILSKTIRFLMIYKMKTPYVSFDFFRCVFIVPRKIHEIIFIHSEHKVLPCIRKLIN